MSGAMRGQRAGFTCAAPQAAPGQPAAMHAQAPQLRPQPPHARHYPQHAQERRASSGAQSSPTAAQQNHGIPRLIEGGRAHNAGGRRDPKQVSIQAIQARKEAERLGKYSRGSGTAERAQAAPPKGATALRAVAQHLSPSVRCNKAGGSRSSAYQYASAPAPAPAPGPSTLQTGAAPPPPPPQQQQQQQQHPTQFKGKLNRAWPQPQPVQATVAQHYAAVSAPSMMQSNAGQPQQPPQPVTQAPYVVQQPSQSLPAQPAAAQHATVEQEAEGLERRYCEGAVAEPPAPTQPRAGHLQPQPAEQRTGAAGSTGRPPMSAPPPQAFRHMTQLTLCSGTQRSAARECNSAQPWRVHHSVQPCTDASRPLLRDITLHR